MDAVTLNRAEWAAVARELDTAHRESAPPGLHARVLALLEAIPAGWDAEACTLELDSASADVVRSIVRRGRGLPEHAGLRRAQDQALDEVDRILHGQQQASHTFRVELRTDAGVVVVARTSAGDAAQAELSQLAARLTADGASGELVLIDEVSGEVVARRRL